MDEIRTLIFGVAIGVFLASCTTFAFKHYGMAGVSYDQGTLLGPKASDDLPFSRCAPDAETKNKCVVMFAKEFFSFKQDYEDCKNRLVECEKSR